METIQVVLDESLLRAADDAARRTNVNRSAFVREAVRRYLRQLQTEELERRDREGFERRANDSGELALWERAATWPEG